ncbi:hypothetical protein P3S67_012507 [Capsicum chacoense]
MADPHAITPTTEPPRPPDPPDLMETNDPHPTASPEPTEPKMTFKAALLNKEDSLNGHYLMDDNEKAPPIPTETGDTVSLSAKDMERIYTLWRYSVIMKLFQKRFAHNYLRTKIVEVWKPTELLTLIDLCNDFYISKLSNLENMQKALHGGPPPSSIFGNFDLPKVIPGIGIAGALNPNHSPLINSISTPLMLEYPNGVHYPTPLGKNPMNASTPTYFGRSNTIATKDNHHLKTVDMTKTVLSINYSFNPPGILNPQIPNKGHILVPSTNNGNFSSQQQPIITEGAPLIHNCATSIQPDTNVMGRTSIIVQVHNSLRHYRGLTNSPLHLRPNLDGTNSKRSSRPNSGGAEILSMVPNPIASSEVGDPQYDKIPGDKLTHALNNPLSLRDENTELRTLEPKEVQLRTPIPTTATGQRRMRNDYLSARRTKANQ